MGSSTPHGVNPTRNAKLIDAEQHCSIYESPDGTEYEQYVITNDGSPNFDNTYAFRIDNPHPHLVQCLHAAPTQNSLGCTQRSRYQIVNERIPYRLDVLPTLTPQNACNLSLAALKGFKDLSRHHGVLHIRESMIGVNQQNDVKVWLNSNFAINSPEETSIAINSIQKENQQKEMVNGIVGLVDQKAQRSGIWADFIQLKDRQSPTTFQAALQLLNQTAEKHQRHLSGTLLNPFNKPHVGPANLENHSIGLRTSNIEHVVSPQTITFSQLPPNTDQKHQTFLQPPNSYPSPHPPNPQTNHFAVPQQLYFPSPHRQSEQKQQSRPPLPQNRPPPITQPPRINFVHSSVPSGNSLRSISVHNGKQSPVQLLTKEASSQREGHSYQQHPSPSLRETQPVDSECVTPLLVEMPDQANSPRRQIHSPNATIPRPIDMGGSLPIEYPEPISQGPSALSQGSIPGIESTRPQVSRLSGTVSSENHPSVPKQIRGSVKERAQNEYGPIVPPRQRIISFSQQPADGQLEQETAQGEERMNSREKETLFHHTESNDIAEEQGQLYIRDQNNQRRMQGPVEGTMLLETRQQEQRPYVSYQQPPPRLSVDSGTLPPIEHGDQCAPPINVHYIQDKNQEVALKPFIPSHGTIPFEQSDQKLHKREEVPVQLVNSQQVRTNRQSSSNRLEFQEQSHAKQAIFSRKNLTYREMRRLLYEQIH